MYASTFSEQMDNLEIFQLRDKITLSILKHCNNFRVDIYRQSANFSRETSAVPGGWGLEAEEEAACRHLTTTAFAPTMLIHDRRRAMQ